MPIAPLLKIKELCRFAFRIKSGRTAEKNKDLPGENLEQLRMVLHIWWKRIVDAGQSQEHSRVSFPLFFFITALLTLVMVAVKVADQQGN